MQPASLPPARLRAWRCRWGGSASTPGLRRQEDANGTRPMPMVGRGLPLAVGWGAPAGPQPGEATVPRV